MSIELANENCYVVIILGYKTNIVGCVFRSSRKAFRDNILHVICIHCVDLYNTLLKSLIKVNLRYCVTRVTKINGKFRTMTLQVTFYSGTRDARVLLAREKNCVHETSESPLYCTYLILIKFSKRCIDRYPISENELLVSNKNLVWGNSAWLHFTKVAFLSTS